jgi:hypothetical protein
MMTSFMPLFLSHESRQQISRWRSSIKGTLETINKQAVTVNQKRQKATAPASMSGGGGGGGPGGVKVC